MAKKDFTQQAQQAAPVYDALINTTEVQDTQDELRTQGRAGMKLPRINLAFSPTNYEFIKIMAALHGQNLTQYVNDLINAERERSSEAFNKAKELRDSL